MSTPRKATSDKEDAEVSEIRTPFRERALEEQRLKDEILIRSTPGYRKLISTSVKSHDILNKDPKEVRSFLQDLSQALARESQDNDTNANENRARNLIDELTYEENRIEDDNFLQSSSGKTTDGNNDYDTHAGYTSLSQTVFAQLQERDKGIKSRKIDPIIIQDALMAEEENEFQTTPSRDGKSISMNVLETPPGFGRDRTDELSMHGQKSIPITEQDEGLSEPLPDPSSMNREEEEGEEEEEEEEEDGAFKDTNNEDADNPVHDPTRLHVPTVRHATVKPLEIRDLKHLTRQFLNENEIILPNQSWSAIQEESLHIMDFLNQKLGSLQKQDLVDSFIDMGIIQNVDDMFELAHELLPLEHQSKIETYLF